MGPQKNHHRCYNLLHYFVLRRYCVMFFALTNNGLLSTETLTQISFLDITSSNSASSAPNPIVAQGDFLLRFAARTIDNTAITVPGTWTVPSGGTVSGATAYGVVAYQFAGAG